MLNGYSDTLPDDCLLDSGVLFSGISAVGVVRGGHRFDPGKEVRNIEYDGKRSDVAGLDRITMFRSVLGGNLIEFGSTDSGDQIRLLEQGSSNADSGGESSPMGTVKTFTPKPAGAFFTSGEYAANIRVIFERSGGGYAAIHFPIAFVARYSLQSADKNEVPIDYEFHARLSAADAASDPGKCPYEIEIRSALPS